MAIEKLSVILELVSGQYKKEAKEAATATSGISGAAKSVTGSLGLMIGPAAIGGAVVALGKMAYEAGENADRLFDLQAQTGATTDQIQEFEFVAKAAGASQEFFTDAVKQVVKSLDTAIAGTGAAADAYEKLGVSVVDSTGEIRAAGDITEEVIGKLAAMPNITERNALAQDIFGKKWEETVSVLDMGSAAIDGLRGEARDLGVVLGGDALRRADKFREAVDKLKVSAQAAAADGLDLIVPILIEIAEEAGETITVLDGVIGLVDKGIDVFTGSADATARAREEADQYTGVLDALIPGLQNSLAQLAGLNTELDENAAATEAARASAAIMADLHKDDLNPVIFDSIELINRQGTAFSNAAKAADTQRQAMINLADFQASQLTPIGNIIRLQQDLAAAQETLATAQANGETPADELALAQLGVAESLLAVQGAGLALTPDQIQAFAQLLITQFGYSEQAALDTLEALNLLDGWTGSATFTLTTINDVVNRAGTNINTDRTKFAQGGIVPGFRGQEQLIVAHGGERITPLSETGSSVSNSRSITYNFVPSPQRGMLDLQYLALLGNHQTFGKF